MTNNTHQLRENKRLPNTYTKLKNIISNVTEQNDKANVTELPSPKNIVNNQ